MRDSSSNPKGQGGQAGVACNICGCASTHFGRGRILSRYEISYYRCGSCGFIQTERPFWLAEAYSDAIAGSDIGSISRSNRNSILTKAVILSLYRQGGRFIDFGGGYGIFVRQMRDLGFDFYRADRYCQNIFAKGLDADLSPGARYEVLTAFEVLEHLSDPLADISEMARLSDSILATTEILPTPPPIPGSWWYYSLSTGQHVAFYTLESLRRVASRLAMNVYSNGTGVHLLTRRRVNPLLFNFLTRPRTSALIHVLRRRPSLLGADWAAAVAREDAAATRAESAAATTGSSSA